MKAFASASATAAVVALAFLCPPALAMGAIIPAPVQHRRQLGAAGRWIDEHKCLAQARKEWDWRQTAPGALHEYDDHRFSGLRCAPAPAHLRDATHTVDAREPGQLLIGQLPAAAQAGVRIECKQGQSFLIGHVRLATERDADIYLQYELRDGSRCYQRWPSVTSASEVRNAKCPDAVALSFFLSDNEWVRGPTKIYVMDVVFYDCGNAMVPSGFDGESGSVEEVGPHDGGV
ncbi:MAG: hypothetical protein M1826_007407 [Phylliscum demangeonii]|nr:MAG: hypothetical protein M1826_007407 [Phylliscum demangeonii]